MTKAKKFRLLPKILKVVEWPLLLWYFEQFDVFNSFVQYNSGTISYAKVTGGESQEMEKKKFIKKCMNALNKIEFYQQYGLLLLQFCLYHKYIFLLKEDEVKGKNKDEGNEISKVVFLLDKVIDEENKGKKVNEKQIDELMNKKLFVSVIDSKEYKELPIYHIPLLKLKNFQKISSQLFHNNIIKN